MRRVYGKEHSGPEREGKGRRVRAKKIRHKYTKQALRTYVVLRAIMIGKILCRMRTEKIRPCLMENKVGRERRNYDQVSQATESNPS